MTHQYMETKIKDLEKRVEALEQEPCDDTISRYRQAVLGIVSGYAEQLKSYIGSPNDSEIYAYSRGLILSIERDINNLHHAIYSENPNRCDDTISRQMVLEKAYKIAGYDRNAYVVDVADIEALPSVSTAKIGQWIDDKCSLCGKGTEDLISNSEWYRNEEPNFCPFCGAKIRR